MRSASASRALCELRAAAVPAARRRSFPRLLTTAALPGLDGVGEQLPVSKSELPKWLAVAALGASLLARRSAVG